MIKKTLILLSAIALLPVLSAYGEKKMEQKNFPMCKNLSDVKKYRGEKVLINGTYEQTPVPGGKKLQAALIVLPDGTELIRSYRPVKSEFKFIGKKVTVIGTVYPDAGQPSYVQQVMAPHIYIGSASDITLAEGETPYDKEPQEIPTLPLVENKAQLEQYTGRWVHLYGELIKITPSESASYLGELVIQLSDGTLVYGVEIWLSHLNAVLKKELTFTTAVYRGKDPAKPWIFYSGNHFCPGKVLRCGMDEEKKTKKLKEKPQSHEK